MALDHPIYVLVGSEPVQRRYLLKRLKEQSGAWEKLSAKEVDPSETAQASLLADPEKPLVRMVEDYEAWKPAQRKEMASLADQLGDGLHIVICAGRLGPKDPIRGAVEEQAIVKLAAPKRGDFPNWVESQARLLGVQIDSPAARALVDRIGESTDSLSAELLRLQPMGPVSRETVERFTPHQAGSEAWDWIDSLVAGRVNDKELALCESSGLEPLMLLGALSKRFCLLCWVKIADQQSAGAKDYPWRLAKGAARDWSLPALKEALASIAYTEQQMKGKSQLDGYTQLGRLSRRLAQSASSKT